MLPLIFYAQTIDNNDSLYKKLNAEINFSKSNTSDIIWEGIIIPEGKELRSFEVTPNNELYIGCNNGGVFKHFEESWELIGLESNTIYDFEMYPENKLLFCTNDLYLWDDIELIMLSESFYPNINNTFGLFFGYNSFSSLYRSLDGCLNWEEVFYLALGHSETIKAIVGTTQDSIFMGTTDFLGFDGGVYLSTDGGDNWNHFGLSQHFIESLTVDNFNQVYAGNNGHYETGQGGLYRYNYASSIWDTIYYFPYITSIVFNTENHIYTGFNTSGMADWGGVMHSEDNGETWILDTAGIGNTWVNELQIDNNGFLYALTGYTTKKLYRTTLPVKIDENSESDFRKTNCFPNPVKNTLSIYLIDKYQDDKSIKLTVFNTLGYIMKQKMLTNQELDKGIIKIDVSDLERGEYIYNIKCGNDNTSNKFIKQ